ncbi:amino acid ABC transporter permease [Microbacterium gorillae]|uniref:amino acid ABC transporter permease n=1 Tax=Microbacterium gorillae TaxID=1231063 RepID=UPI0006934990|nr:amino acid ABC transporter permease [Microbacterium gorillae]
MALTTRQRRVTSQSIQITVFVAIVVVILLLVNWPVVIENFFSFGKVKDLFRTIFFPGLVNTVLYTLTSFVFGLSLGLVLALMKTASFPPYRWFATAYIEFFRGLPALVVLLAFGYGVPMAFGAKWDFWVTVMVSLGLVSAAYMAETLRAGLQAVPKGQTEAARSLGMSHGRALSSIVIPQAFRIVLPPLTNELIMLTKDTSLVSVLGMATVNYELTKLGRDGLLSLGGGMTPLVVVGVFYLAITLPLSLLARWFEKRTEQVSRPKKTKQTEVDA